LTSQTPTLARPAMWENLLLGVPWQRVHRLLPGVGLTLAVMLLAERLSVSIGWVALRLRGIEPTGRASAISPITCAILIGLVVANSIGVHAIFRPGLDFSVKKLLRLGIILVGIRLSLLDVLRLGVWGIPVVVTVIGAALILTGWIARRLGLSERLGALAAASTAICGVTAALAVAPSIEANEQEVAYTVANVTIFGMFAMLVYPYLAHLLFGPESGAAGLFLGTAIHDTSQVMGAAMAYKDVFGDELAMKVATITKLTRNVFLAGVVPLLAFYFARKRGGGAKRLSIVKLLPLFVLGFLGMAVLRSIGDAGATGPTALSFGLWRPEVWGHITKMLGESVASSALGAAMAAVGLTTSLKALRVLGLRPFYVGAASAIVVGAVGLCLAALVGPRIHLGVGTAVAANAPSPPRVVNEAREQVLVTPPSSSAPSEAPRESARAPSDSDSDGILDANDACPEAGGRASHNPRKNGCPAVRVDHGQILTLEPIKFRHDSAEIHPASRPVLLAIVKVLREHEDIKKISVNGYTDDRGNRKHNVDLSRRRAAAVKRWLAGHHIPRARLQSKGFGPEQPIDTNETKEGRRHNRRIELEIVDSTGG